MNKPLSHWSVRLIYLSVVLSGAATLGVELSASRLLGSVFGTGNLVWASIIGLVMLHLALGYFLGGRLADRRPAVTWLYVIIAWGAFLTGVAPYLFRLVMLVLDSLVVPHVVAMLVVVILLLGPPVTLLGCVSPFVIRLLVTQVGETGRSAGYIYAWSTLGSVLGSLAPVLYMLPALGVTVTFGVLGGMLLVVAIVGLLVQGDWRLFVCHSWMPVVLVLIWVMSP